MKQTTLSSMTPNGTRSSALSANDTVIEEAEIVEPSIDAEAKKMNSNSESFNSSRTDLEDDGNSGDEAIAEIVTDVIKKEPEVLERIMQDEEVRHMVMVQQKSYRGPLPPSELLSGYEAFCPGATERFIGQLEANQKHQHEMEKLAVSATITRDQENRKFGFALTCLALVASVTLGVTGHDFLAGTIATTTIGTILVTFILNRRPNNSKDDKEEPQTKLPAEDNNEQ
ncbi:DUF2335 domain-containing protein [Leclercia adecarboxylata]|uniref:DUF2335 domain-containing protein n=1 Tax=Leclercia adecarboxylata TaxID=83655 RepID=UPI00194E5092|nr:DUF2335 domain-containing protein [Leclercia adecarboxylata]MBM6634636.1 DUF2335 domain-containing protein [Leclercia adecarboxylata]